MTTSAVTTHGPSDTSTSMTTSRLTAHGPSASTSMKTSGGEDAGQMRSPADHAPGPRALSTDRSCRPQVQHDVREASGPLRRVLTDERTRQRRGPRRELHRTSEADRACAAREHLRRHRAREAHSCGLSDHDKGDVRPPRTSPLLQSPTRAPSGADAWAAMDATAEGSPASCERSVSETVSEITRAELAAERVMLAEPALLMIERSAERMVRCGCGGLVDARHRRARCQVRAPRFERVLRFRRSSTNALATEAHRSPVEDRSPGEPPAVGSGGVARGYVADERRVASVHAFCRAHGAARDRSSGCG